MLSRMLSIVAGGGIAAGAASYGINRYMSDMPGDPETLEHSSAYNFLEGTFGGSNVALNLAAGLGGNYLGNKAKARGQRLVKRSDGIMNRVKAGGDLHYERRRMAGRGYQSTSGMRNLPVASKGYYSASQKHFIGMGNPTSDFLGVDKRITHASGLKAKGLSAIKTATRLKRVANIAAWAPMAFMAFDMVGSLSDLPAPNHGSMQRKGASLSGTFMDTSMAHTQRRRALQAMHSSQYTGRAGLGNEAALLHR